jgi:hypothetical protein
MTIDQNFRNRPAMTETELESKLDEIDRLLNDPDTSLEPGRVWSLLAEVKRQDVGSSAVGTAAA